MKTCLTIGLIVLLVASLLFGGLIFAVRPPFRVIQPQNAGAVQGEGQTAFAGYILERFALAYDDYSGEGDIEVLVDQAGLTQVLANALGDEISGLPLGSKFTGVFMNIRQDQIQIGGAFKLLLFPVGISARMHVKIEDGQIVLKLLSTHLGRISLPINFMLKSAGRFVDMPEELSTLSVSVPIDFEDAELGSISHLELQPQQILIKLQLAPGLIPEISDTMVASFEESLPEMQDILVDNPTALAALEEIQATLNQAKTEDKPVNPLRLLALGEKLHRSLSDQEIKELDGVLDDDIKDLLQQVRDSN